MSVRVESTFGEDDSTINNESIQDLKDAFKQIFTEPKRSLDDVGIAIPKFSSSKKLQRASKNKKINIFKKRDNSKSSNQGDESIQTVKPFNSSIIQKQAELFDNTFVNEVNEYNRLLEDKKEPEQVVKSLMQDKNSNKIF